MFRKEKLELRNSLYHDEKFKASTDFQWYSSLDKDIKVACIPEVLFLYRRHEDQLSTGGYKIQQKFSDIIRRQQLNKIGLEPTEEEFSLHRILSYSLFVEEIDNQLFYRIIKWCEKIKSSNDKYRIFNRFYLNKILTDRLIDLLQRNSMINLDQYNMILESCFYNYLPHYNQQFDRSKFEGVIKQLKNKKIIIFGTKLMGYLLKKSIENKGLRVFSFVDNNKLNRGRMIEEVPIITPENVDFTQECVFLISILSDARYEVRKQLIEKCRVEEGNIFLLSDLGYHEIF